MADVAYVPDDVTQGAFLSALALGETGGVSNAYSLGYAPGGGVDLSTTAQHDAFGFPVWSGFGGSHAAGAFQFEPKTWDYEAAQHGLNFANPADQNAAAWYEAQDTYAAKTGGRSLYQDLKAGDFSRLQDALKSIWPSVTGNAAAPAGLAADIAAGKGANLDTANAPNPDAVGNVAGNAAKGIVGGLLSPLTAAATDTLVRAGLIAIGGVILFVALWQLLANAGAVPSPKDALGAAGKAALAA